MSEYDKIADRAIPPDPDLLTALKMMLRSFERSTKACIPMSVGLAR